MEKSIYSYKVDKKPQTIGGFAAYIIPTSARDAYIDSDDYYIADIGVVTNDMRGHGVCEIRIYTNNKLECISFGNWKLEPVIKMPFNWEGYSVQAFFISKEGKRFIKSFCFDNTGFFYKKGYSKEVEGIFNKLKELDDNYINFDHYNFMNYVEYIINQTKSQDKLSFREFNDICEHLFNAKKTLLPKLKGAQETEAINYLNKLIDYLNSIKIGHYIPINW